MGRGERVGGRRKGRGERVGREEMGPLRLQFAVYRYVEGVSGREEKEWRLTDELEGREWGEQVDGRDFVFFQVRFRFVSRLLGGEVDGVIR